MKMEILRVFLSRRTADMDGGLPSGWIERPCAVCDAPVAIEPADVDHMGECGQILQCSVCAAAFMAEADRLVARRPVGDGSFRDTLLSETLARAALGRATKKGSIQ